MGSCLGNCYELMQCCYEIINTFLSNIFHSHYYGFLAHIRPLQLCREKSRLPRQIPSVSLLMDGDCGIACRTMLGWQVASALLETSLSAVFFMRPILHNISPLAQMNPCLRTWTYFWQNPLSKIICQK